MIKKRLPKLFIIRKRPSLNGEITWFLIWSAKVKKSMLV